MTKRTELNKTIRRMETAKIKACDYNILTTGQEVLPYEEYKLIENAVKQYYHFSSSEFWMWKMLQFGYAYGKRAERARRRKYNEQRGIERINRQDPGRYKGV